MHASLSNRLRRTFGSFALAGATIAWAPSASAQSSPPPTKPPPAQQVCGLLVSTGSVSVQNQGLFPCACMRRFTIGGFGITIGVEIGANGGLVGNCWATTIVTPPTQVLASPGPLLYVRTHRDVTVTTRTCDTTNCGLFSGAAQCEVESTRVVGTVPTYHEIGACPPSATP